MNAILGALGTTFGQIAVDKIRYNYSLVTGLDKELDEIPDMLEKAREELDDAEYTRFKKPSVERWLKKLEKVAYELEDILDEWNYKSLLKLNKEASAAPQNAEASAAPQNAEVSAASVTSCYNAVGNYFKSAASLYNSVSNSDESTSSSLSIADKIKNVKSTLVKLLEERKGFTLESSSQRRTERTSTSFIDVDKVFGSGIQEMKNNIVSKLTLGGDGIQILSIVGDGGLGKTKLAQLIFSDPQFDTDWLKIWVCVSTPFVVNVVAANIFNLVGQGTMPPHNNQPEFALQNLKAAISGKKYLLVLDDVWTENKKEWEPLKVVLKKGKPGSKILVTTRNKGVADALGTLKDDIYYPEKLGVYECWEILRDTSSLATEEEEYGEFEEVGMKIASKCKGLPLVAVVLGNLLEYKNLDMWKDVEKSEIWKLKNAKVELFPVWVLSYNNLSADLKRCFSYCAVYPKDHKIHAETLIEEWMAQGYLGSDSGNGELELIGRENLNNLARLSLFQDIEKSELGGQIEWCKMHDIVHDFALYLRENDDKKTSSCQVCGQSWVSRVQEYRSLSRDWIAHLEEKKSWHICNCLKSVRVLRIKYKDPVLEMNTLIHLRWLDLCCDLSNDKLKIICGLYFLQTLKLPYCKLSGIPPEIGNLVKLRYLDLSGNLRIKELPDIMKNLVELRSLLYIITLLS